MNSDTLIAALLDADVRLMVQDGRLKLDAPHALPDEVLSILRSCRDELIESFFERAAIREFDGGFARTDAERFAWDDLRTWVPCVD